MFSVILFLLAGLVLLIVGAEGLVRGSASLARKWGISELAIGLTVVALGTSMPELTVNIFAAVNKSADIGIGNIIGSNIANILLILGLSAAITPLNVKGSTVWKEIPFALLAVILVFVMGNDMIFDEAPFNGLTRTDGIALMSFFIIFLVYIIGMRKNDGADAEKVTLYSYPLSLGMTIGGLLLLVGGGKLLVENAIVLARLAGLSESLIGLTIVAIGTSLPELATSVVAVLHKHHDIAVGNIVGSNIFNVFWILGLTSTLLPLPFNPQINTDVLIAIGTTLLLFLSPFGEKFKITRSQGIVFVLTYIGYLVYLIQRG